MDTAGPSVKIHSRSEPRAVLGWCRAEDAPTKPLTKPLTAKQVARARKAGCEMWLAVVDEVSEDTASAAAAAGADGAGSAPPPAPGATSAPRGGSAATGPAGLETPTPLVSEEAMADLLKRHASVFATNSPDQRPLERDTGDTVPLVPGAQPQFRRGRRMSPLELEEVRKSVREMLERDQIEPSKSPWGTGAVRAQEDW